jgi:hypothetical protein
MSRWKKANWDKWTFWHKVRHVLAVIASLLCVAIMGLVFLWFVDFISGFDIVSKLRDVLVREIVNFLK